MPKKEPTVLTTAKLTNQTNLLIALFALIGTLAVGYWQFGRSSSAQASPPVEVQYLGRVLDVNTQQPIAGAKITLDLQGVPPIVYTDSEGVYQFKVALSVELNGRVRVDAPGYEVYSRNISLNPDLPTIEDIRLTPAPASTTDVQPVSTVTAIPAWSGTLTLRRPVKDEALADIPPSLWKSLLIDPADMPQPGTNTYTGSLPAGGEYMLISKWCATTPGQLDQNIVDLETVFSIDNSTVPTDQILEYTLQQANGWACAFYTVNLSGWQPGLQYHILVRQTLKADLFDGQTTYPAGVYNKEITVTVK